MLTIYFIFYRLHNLYDFPTLKGTCSYLHGCPLDQIDKAISRSLPEVLSRYHKLLTKAGVTSLLPERDELREARSSLPSPQHTKSLQTRQLMWKIIYRPRVLLILKTQMKNVSIRRTCPILSYLSIHKNLGSVNLCDDYYNIRLLSNQHMQKCVIFQLLFMLLYK